MRSHYKSSIEPSKQLATAALVNLLNTAQNDSYLWIAVGDLGNFGLANLDAIAALTRLIALQKIVIFCFMQHIV
ncbi:hypothetical protein [Aliterella atlantica]|uniref:hypothetical protein n=1 Tax=Aliterella atlantica TaxID=1827278 RepID=UPI00118471FA|nr:hypothetical protein [Aliterella atlantica]